jgi:hypothetical protein
MLFVFAPALFLTALAVEDPKSSLDRRIEIMPMMTDVAIKIDGVEGEMKASVSPKIGDIEGEAINNDVEGEAASVCDGVTCGDGTCAPTAEVCGGAEMPQAFIKFDGVEGESLEAKPSTNGDVYRIDLSMIEEDIKIDGIDGEMKASVSPKIGDIKGEAKEREAVCNGLDNDCDGEVESEISAGGGGGGGKVDVQDIHIIKYEAGPICDGFTCDDGSCATMIEDCSIDADIITANLKLDPLKGELQLKPGNGDVVCGDTDHLASGGKGDDCDDDDPTNTPTPQKIGGDDPISGIDIIDKRPPRPQVNVSEEDAPNTPTPQKIGGDDPIPGIDIIDKRPPRPQVNVSEEDAPNTPTPQNIGGNDPIPGIDVIIKRLPKPQANGCNDCWVDVESDELEFVSTETEVAWTQARATQNNTLAVKGIEQKSLFGLFKVNMEVETEFDTQGTMGKINRPWYSFLAW